MNLARCQKMQTSSLNVVGMKIDFVVTFAFFNEQDFVVSMAVRRIGRQWCNGQRDKWFPLEILTVFKPENL
jgi:hypothetical protein